MVHSTDNYTLGKGILSVGNVALAPVYEEIGNCPSISIEIEEERLEHFSARGGLKNRDLYPLIQVKYNVVFECDEITTANLVLFLKGTESGDTIYAFDNTDEEYSLKFVEDNPLGPNRTWYFHRGILSANGALENIGDDWKKLAFKFEGLTDETYHPESPNFSVEGTTTT